jgi:hypothetical protein
MITISFGELIGVLTIIFMLIGGLLKLIYNKLDDRLKALEVDVNRIDGDINSVRTNYKSEFKNVREDISDLKEHIRDLISEISTPLTKLITEHNLMMEKNGWCNFKPNKDG